jgi:3-deoxy-D-manno-octulosonate 8-phosphate phosphatase (KDO 8-P phosphatase)
MAMLKAVGTSYAPKDAVREIKQTVKCVTKQKGGHGAVRNMIEDILKRENSFEKFIEIWR